MTSEQRRLAVLEALKALDEQEWRSWSDVSRRAWGQAIGAWASAALGVLKAAGLAEGRTAAGAGSEWRRTAAGTAELTRPKEATRNDG